METEQIPASKDQILSQEYPQQDQEGAIIQREQASRRRTRSTRKSTAPSWFIRLLAKYSPSYLLQNKGATARDHLANERTFLAYLRTSLGMLTLGVAIVQLFRASSTANTQSGVILGTIFMALGLVFLILGTIRYYYAQALMVKGLFPSSRGVVGVMSISMLVLIIVIIVNSTLV
ncbi:hypothetical protein MIR68_007722 [Amoeboaphelidium protococcarum]|nr:hypothetical protein MIR68_007722 [Amoeboaphelidium protococcarum]KAI3645453.1 hypothetical protein MP228_008381 [Amoeboaphelidium protococcarum]